MDTRTENRMQMHNQGPRRGKVGALVLAVGAVGLLAAGCGSSDSSGKSDSASAASGSGSGGNCNVSFGIFGPLTGTSGSYGQTGLQAAKLAIADFTKTNPKCKIGLVQYDSQGDPAPAPGLARKAIDDKSIVAIDGPSFSGEVEAADPIFDAAGMPTVTASATATNLATKGWKTFHRTVVNDGQEGPAEAQYLVKQKGFKRIAVVDNGQAYGKGLATDVADAAKKLGATIVDDQSVDANGTDYSSTINKIRAAKPDVVYCGCLDPEAARLVKQLRSAGDKTPYSGGAGLQTTKFIKEAGVANAEGTMVGSGGADTSQSASGKAFVAKWQAAFHVAPGLYGVEYYNAATAILTAIGAGKTTRQDISAYLATESFKGPTGSVAFAPNGNVKNAQVNFYDIKGGKFEFTTQITVGS
jgi:branched-chain amino acid transport system substrate-binding protein